MARNNAINLLVIVTLLTAVVGCAPTQSLPRHQIDDSVWFETGAAEEAEQVSGLLADAMTRVEKGHQHPYRKQPVIFLFATEEKFEHATGYHGDRVAGLSTPGGVYLSPQDPAAVQAVLTHELSHVLLRQWTGDYRFYRTPIWFREGIATWVSAGGGAGPVSAAKAQSAITEGRTFRPNLVEGAIFRSSPTRSGLSYQMFYRQSAMFVDFLAHTHPVAWNDLLTGVHQGLSFSRAYRESFDAGIDVVWQSFIDDLAGDDSDSPSRLNNQQGGDY